ncbi:hypothetical protein Cylst_0643 [Cylindrospermum stagnale PCC 7417]|uniref:Uncharacterized protein n=1 Tax=Cylindrospermum stagnale PCC 7417 TaxID=56107 RepID=K9WT46_9NOST|nr:hypothetical protein [Cylindrospermum stagnale]AFZ22974.1 hypothetical protein Cylst_0643 [Cylindrospermum stagnale PCC 7417]
MAIKNWKNNLFLGLTGAFFAVGYSSLLATETPLQNTPTLNKDSLAQSETNLKVSEYLEKNKPESYNYLKKQLEAGIEDAKKPSQDKVVNNLWSLSASNPKIKMRNNNGKDEYLMVIWTQGKYIPKEWKRGAKINIERQSWLTAASEVKDFCQNCKGTGIDIPGNIMLSLRLQQYLGLVLNKNSEKTHFVEMWVKAEDLSRPCIDPEINDSSCKALPVTVLDKYPVLQKIYTDSYAVGKQNYPWTGLGYTYDWGNPNKPRQGASEFLINGTNQKPTEVEIADVKATQEYCNNQFLK